MQADPKTTAAISVALHKMAESYAKRDTAGMLSAFAPDADTLVFGTQADEKRIGTTAIRAQMERDWAHSDAASFDVGWTAVSAAGNVAWLAADMAFTVTTGGQAMSFPGRLTAVMEKRGDRWLIAQFHASLPAAGGEGGSVPKVQSSVS